MSQPLLRSQPLARWCANKLLAAVAALLLACSAASAADIAYPPVTPGSMLQFPADHGAHPDFRTEWWYATGWLETEDGKPIGFQVTFFRSRTAHDPANPSKFAPKQLVIAHAAISDPRDGRLLHDQKSAREGWGLAWAKTGDTDVGIDNWRFQRDSGGRYQAQIEAREFSLALQLAPTQALMLQGEQGFSRKGPRPGQASFYYSQPQLTVSGTLTRGGRASKLSGRAWLDHEWSSSVLDERASGWDWVGANLDDGSALMMFRIRAADGSQIWSHAALRDPAGRVTRFAPAQVSFTPLRTWRSPRTATTYPVAGVFRTGDIEWRLTPLQDDQELDSRQSTGAVYWEGAVKIEKNGKPAGRGYLELTGYQKALKL